MGKNQWVSKRQDGLWAVTGEGNSKATKLFDNQQDARAFACEIAINQQSELIVKNAKGEIREKNSYGPDKCPPKG